jgi:hypothetical protein
MTPLSAATQETMSDPSSTILETLVNQSTCYSWSVFYDDRLRSWFQELKEIVEISAAAVQIVHVDVTAYPHITECVKIRVIPTWLIFAFPCGPLGLASSATTTGLALTVREDAQSWRQESPQNFLLT